jgi:hypothetical protein
MFSIVTVCERAKYICYTLTTALPACYSVSPLGSNRLFPADCLKFLTVDVLVFDLPLQKGAEDVGMAGVSASYSSAFTRRMVYKVDTRITNNNRVTCVTVRLVCHRGLDR